jgi:hypothetical protein
MDGIQIATCSDGVITYCSMETRWMLFSKIFFHVHRHTKELRELRESKCTGFCRRMSFISDASDRLRTLIICMILAYMGI